VIFSERRDVYARTADQSLIASRRTSTRASLVAGRGGARVVLW
jgi:hypothetical protein